MFLELNLKKIQKEIQKFMFFEKKKKKNKKKVLLLEQETMKKMKKKMKKEQVRLIQAMQIMRAMHSQNQKMVAKKVVNLQKNN